MKRSPSDSHIQPCSSAQRHKASCADVRSARASPSAPTQAAFDSWLQSISQPSTQEEGDETMAAPPTPRSTTSHSRGRVARRDARSRSSRSPRRTPSPSKPTPQTYRTRNLHHANVFVKAELPQTIDDELRQVLGITSWEDPLEGPDEPRFNDAVNCYLTDSIRNDEDCALEGEWKTSLSGLIRKLLPISRNELKMNTSEEMWNSALKPKGPSLDEDDDNSGTQTPRSSQAALPSFNPNNAFSGPVPSLPPPTPSIATSTDMEGVNPFYISTPKPDITVGLAHTTFQPGQQRSLVVHQASQTILSDPHPADMGLRFPFLVVEAKGSSLNGSLVSAQNQAAVSGAAMLSILQDLSDQAEWCGAKVPDFGATSQEIPALCISIVTMGPIHDLNVHFMVDEKHYMCPFQTYRTTFRKDAQKFVALLVQILKWGKERYKEGIVEKLDRVLGNG